jgi:benzoate-CoA ligase
MSQEGLVLPHAFVVLREGLAPSEALATELRAYLRASLSPHKAPRSMQFCRALPKTASGKLDRKSLREQLAASQAAGPRPMPPTRDS